MRLFLKLLAAVLFSATAFFLYHFAWVFEDARHTPGPDNLGMAFAFALFILALSALTLAILIIIFLIKKKN